MAKQQSKTPLLSGVASDDADLSDEDLFIYFISDADKETIKRILQQVRNVADADESVYQSQDKIIKSKPKIGVKQIKDTVIQIDSQTKDIKEQQTLRKLYNKYPAITLTQIIDQFRYKLTLYYLNYITNYFKDPSIVRESKQQFDQYIRDHCKLSCVGSMVSAISSACSRRSHRGNGEEIKCELPSYANPTATRGLMGLKFLIGYQSNLGHITPDHFINLAKQLEKSTKQPYELNLRDLYRVITNSTDLTTSRSSTTGSRRSSR